MPLRFHSELEKIKNRILWLGRAVEERVRMAGEVIKDYDLELTKQLINTDYEIDEAEIDVEEECLKVLALYQPVAGDLRFLIAVIKINNELERIADEAVNIAQRVEIMAEQKKCDYYFDYTQMVEKAHFMLESTLEALVNSDVTLAFDVCKMDEKVDNIKKDAYHNIKEAMRRYPDHINVLINMLLISRHLERMADHSTNIAEEIVYIHEGEIIRHYKTFKRYKDISSLENEENPYQKK